MIATIGLGIALGVTAVCLFRVDRRLKAGETELGGLRAKVNSMDWKVERADRDLRGTPQVEGCGFQYEGRYARVRELDRLRTELNIMGYRHDALAKAAGFKFVEPKSLAAEYVRCE